MNVKKKGFAQLGRIERFRINRLIRKKEKEISQKLHQPAESRIQIKTYSSEGRNKKSSVHLEMRFNNKKFESDFSGWNIYLVMRHCFDSILNQIEHEFHLSDSHHAYRKKPKSLKKPKDFEELRERSWK